MAMEDPNLISPLEALNVQKVADPTPETVLSESVPPVKDIPQLESYALVELIPPSESYGSPIDVNN